MIVYPAIDLRGGKVVRLKEGDPNRQTIYSDNPVATARLWQAAGAAWLHVVNLDGALGALDAQVNTGIVREIAALDGVRVQFGGGLRDAAAVERAFDLGVDRVVVGTAAVTDPGFAAEMVGRWGADRVSVALDAREGVVVVKGWRQPSNWSPLKLGLDLAALGVRHILYTDVSRDGLGAGVNVEATARLARLTRLDVVASGGVASLDDVRALKETGLVAGVVVGRALYEGEIDLAAALKIAAG
ncbi:MAG: 1-(5-phosphoribosyl)-5-[(5-phosphoribosylamino)methylideneamino]imidazole-4-carboxamide isomerase [Anaerolineae bacterium]|nr:1-(5-phosphoribosyl)-5-[(5-phosphoribosylamino)methylideneamino]imidazole-4-carboxamide isomerase [Anaerolineae bacterium]